jgi:TonB family protein
MIPRILVPQGARLPEGEIVTTRRRPSSLDERTLVPSTLPVVPLDGHSSIPANLPLEAIATRTVVPRDIDVDAVQRPDESQLPPQPTEMDERVTIPQGVSAPAELPALLPVSEDLVEPDIFQTGELSFLPTIRAPQTTTGEMFVAGTSLVLNILFIIALVAVLTYRSHTREAEEIGRKQMEVLLPPGALESLKPSTPPAARPSMKVDPREIRKVAPTIEPPVAPPEPKPEPPKRELPSAPAPQVNVPTPNPQPAQGARGDLPKTPLKLETPSMPVPQSGLILPKNASPGDNIRDAIRGLKPNAPPPIGGGGPIGGSGRGGGGGHGTAGGAIQMLTDTEGVDFNDYLHRVYIIVKNNWFAVMPSSVQLGDNGEVSLVFKIYRNGSVVDSDPTLVYGSGKEPLDRAAMSSIRASNPFPPLPSQFKAPYIELRYTYCYNEQTCPIGR